MEPKDQPAPAEPEPTDPWGLPAATTHMDEPVDLELGCCADDDPEDPY